MRQWKNEMKRLYKEFLTDDSGMGVVEIILIIVVLIGLVILFSEQLNSLVNSIFDTINSRVGDVS